MAHQELMSQKVDAFKSVMETFIRRLEAVSDADAQRPPKDGGWNPAQIGWHVATTNQLLAGAVKGEVPMAKPVAEDFREDAQIFSRIPEKVETFPQLQPPAVVTRAEALEKLRASIAPVVEAFSTLTEARATGHYVQFPMGPMTMYQFADFTVGHVPRHLAQLERATS